MMRRARREKNRPDRAWGWTLFILILYRDFCLVVKMPWMIRLSVPRWFDMSGNRRLMMSSTRGPWLV